MSLAKNIDVLHPFRKPETNRAEILLVEYDGFIRNKSANLVTAMLLDYPKWSERYPNLSIFLDMKPAEIFDTTKLYDHYELMVALSGKSIEEIDGEALIMDIVELESVDTNEVKMNTTFGFALSKMTKEKCFTKIYVVKEYTFTDQEIEYIQSLFGKISEKVECIEGETIDAYLAHSKELTTIFVNHIETILKIPEMNSSYKEDTSNQLFILRSSNENTEYDKELGIYHYTITELTNTLEENQIYTGIMSVDMIMTDDKEDPVCAG